METEQEAKSYEARIWWVLWFIALGVLLYTAYHHISEYHRVHGGHCIEAEYFVYNGRELAMYRDENNINHSYDLSGYDAVHEEDTVKLYYTDNVSLAEPRRTPSSWIAPYFFSTAALAFFSWILIRIYRRPH